MAVTIFEALRLIDQTVSPLSTEIIPIEDALSRVSADTVHATIALPTFNNSAMDGYGLKGDANAYTIIGKILAGDSHTYELHEGECIKILTGAEVPDSVDRIVPQENTEVSDGKVIVKKEVPTGANIRHRGEDIHENETVVTKGDIITSAHIGLMASQGMTHIEVYRKLRVGVFASGSELKLHFEKLGKSQIYNSNTLYLLARCEELGAETRFVGKSEDSIQSLKALVKAAFDCDVIITSGGVSVGEADYTKAAFSELGMETLFEKVQIKPGKPTTFGKIGDIAILNLPGNPLASALNFELFGKFLLHKRSGQKAPYHATIDTVTDKVLRSPRPVANVIPGFYNGRFFTPAEKFAPGMVNVLNHCNGMVILDAKTDEIKKGGKVNFLPMRWDFLREDFETFTS